MFAKCSCIRFGAQDGPRAKRVQRACAGRQGTSYSTAKRTFLENDSYAWDQHMGSDALQGLGRYRA